MSEVWSQLQTTLAQTSQGIWVRWQSVPDQVWNSTDTIVSSEGDHVETERDGTEVETVGEGSDVSQGTGEGTKGCSAEEDSGEEESGGREWKKTAEQVS